MNKCQWKRSRISELKNRAHTYPNDNVYQIKIEIHVRDVNGCLKSSFVDWRI